MKHGRFIAAVAGGAFALGFSVGVFGGDHGAVLKDVLIVGNGAAGTVSVIDTETLKSVGTINVVPDLKERLAEIDSSFIRRTTYSIIKKGQALKDFEPSGGDRFVDDLQTSPDGTRLYVSRSNLGDVAAFDLTDPNTPMLWRTVIAGYKADHFAMSPGGARLTVSASLGGKAQVLDTATGAIVGEFKAGKLPHQNDYSRDGTRIYNASIGLLNLPYTLRAFKGATQITVVDAQTLKKIRTYKFKFGIRPAVFSADEKTLYAQLSYLNGVVKFDLESGKVVATSDQPLSEFARKNFSKKDDYPHNSAHHGLALSGDGARLCDAGTIDGTVSIVSTADMKVESMIDVGLMPYWATTSADGKLCYISVSGEDAIAVIDYETQTEVARIPTGKYPQRNKLGRIRY